MTFNKKFKPRQIPEAYNVTVKSTEKWTKNFCQPNINNLLQIMEN